MGEIMTIGQLATRAGVADSTVRYYERRGLLRPTGRTEANYRIYGPESVARLHFIRAAQSSGLSLDDIHTLLGFSDGAVAPCEEVQAVIDARLEHVRNQLKDLRKVQRALEGLHEACCRNDRRGPCPAIQVFQSD